MTDTTQAAKTLELLAGSLKRNEMFHTPTSKEEATQWCEVQGHDRTIGFMVGYNYAIEMIRQIIDGTHPGLADGESNG